MRRLATRLTTLSVLSIAAVVAGCEASDDTPANVDIDTSTMSPQGASDWAGGGSNWGGGGSNWAGAGSWWTGGGSNWAGGGSNWGGGSGQWAGGANYWGAGGSNWAGADNWWSGGGSNWGGGGSNWAGGGSNWAGGGSNWAGNTGLWSGGFANTFPFLGWSYARQWIFRGVPKQGYAAPLAFSATQDTSSCPAGQVRLGGFWYAIDVEGWPGYVALGYTKKLCIPTPGGAGLTMNATATVPGAGYRLTRDLTNQFSDAFALSSMVGWGGANIATQYGGALCASIGTFAAARRSCGVGIVFSDPNHASTGRLTQRGVPMSAAQHGAFSYATPFGRAEGHGVYGEAPNDMESYAGHVLMKHVAERVPATAAGIDDWNRLNGGRQLAYNGAAFSPVPMTARGALASKLQSDAIRGVTAPLNMIPVDASGVLASDMQLSVKPKLGDLYALTLHSTAFHQSPLYGSGGARWFFHDRSDSNAANRPLMDLSSIYQGGMNVLTGYLRGGASGTADAVLTNPYISPLDIKYADFHGNPAGQLYIDHAGQKPATVVTDTDRERRLRAALDVTPPDDAADPGLATATGAGVRPVITSQASVLVNFAGASPTGPVAGHVTPMPFSMRNSATGNMALMVSYDPLAVAAAEFIEQYDAHIAACNATTGEDITESQQQQGLRLWACSNPVSKASYLAGMASFLDGAREYLFGRADGCVASIETVAGAACPTTLVNPAQAHLPYTFWVPAYTSSAYNAEYYGQLASALASYQSAVLGGAGTRLERTLQLANARVFGNDNAVVTSRVARSGTYTSCTD